MEINYNRIKSLYEKNSATKKEMEDIQMGYDMAAAQVNAVKEMEAEINDVLSYAVIKAPFDGYIVNKFF
jgi:multidrug resistance efflux pump